MKSSPSRAATERLESSSSPLVDLRDPRAERLALRVVDMLSAHPQHLNRPEYLQPLTPTSVTIELDAKKSPLALLAQTCSQIGKADPPTSSKERASRSGLKLGEQRPPSADKCSFKPYHKGGVATGDDQLSGLSANAGLKVLTGTHGNTAKSPKSYTARPFSPSWGTGSTQPAGGVPPSPLGRSPNNERETASPSSTSSECSGGGGHGKKDSDASRPTSADTHLAHFGPARNSENLGRLTPISPYKTAHPLIPLPPYNVTYQSAVVGAYAGYPPQLAPKHPCSRPLTRTSPPFFMQGLCRDPYCLSYQTVPHLSSQEPSSLKASFPLVYAAHPPHPFYSYIVPSDALPHVCKWEATRGPSDELLAHQRANNTVNLEADPKAPSSVPSACRQHLPHTSGSEGYLRVGLTRYHPYSNKSQLPAGPGPAAVPLRSLPSTGPYYPHFALYNQRLGPVSTLGYL